MVVFVATVVLLVMVKVKLNLEEATKTQMESRCITLLFLQPQR